MTEDSPVVVETPKTPKSERSLFKSQQKNSVHNLHTTANLTLDNIRSQHTSLRQTRSPSSRRGLVPGKDYAVSNEKAEERLSLTVSKEDFARMRIVGQFNLGFIIAVRERQTDNDQPIEDVFIIDQHASDEKYNFERLQAETIMQVQTLAR
jgi:DNA mismatch repair protein PMS2